MKKKTITMSESGIKKYRIEKVAPDGGWGFLVASGLAIQLVCLLFGC